MPAAVAGYLAQAQTDYQNALAALKAQNLAGYQSDIEAMAQQITLAQQALGKPSVGDGLGVVDHVDDDADVEQGQAAEGQHDLDHGGDVGDDDGQAGRATAGTRGRRPTPPPRRADRRAARRPTSPSVSAVRTGRGGGG